MRSSWRLGSRQLSALADTTATPEEIAWGFRRLFEEVASSGRSSWSSTTSTGPSRCSSTSSSTSRLRAGRPAPRCSAWRGPSCSTSARAGRRRNRTRRLITLEPLSGLGQRNARRPLLGASLPERRARIVEVAEGNPLFVEQLVAHAGRGRRRRARLPPTLQALLAARIDRLPSRERSVVERGSVEGRLFHRGAVAALLPEPERTARRRAPTHAGA